MLQTKIREQMRKVIQVGIDGWIAAQFSAGEQPTDSLTEYPLTPDTVMVYYHSIYPYQTIEDAFLASIGNVRKLDNQMVQAWINYHWQYAHLELAERFDVPVIPLTDDMQERREQLRQGLYEQGYKLKEYQS
mgnify:CR=1 FL=1